MDKKQSKFNVFSTYGVILIIVSAVAGFAWIQWTQSELLFEPGPKVRVNVSMFSGRPDPYFEGASANTIEDKIKDLPPLEEKLNDRFGNDMYTLDLPSGKGVTVYSNGISVYKDGNDAKPGQFRDARGLKQYLDRVRKKYGLMDGMTDKPFTQ